MTGVERCPYGVRRNSKPVYPDRSSRFRWSLGRVGQLPSVDHLALKVDEVHRPILLENRGEKGKPRTCALRVARTQADTPTFECVLLDYIGHLGSPLPTPRRYCGKWTSANNPIRQSGEVQCLGETPRVSWATALRPDAHQVRLTRSWVNRLIGMGRAPGSP